MLDQEFADLLTNYLPMSPEQMTGELRLRDAGLDSIHSIDLLLAIEDKYAIEFPPDLLSDATFDTAGSLWAAVGRITRATSDGNDSHG